MTSCCVFCLQIHANTTTKSSTLRFILQTTHAPFYHSLMLVIEVLSSAATLIAQKTVIGDDVEGWGKARGWILHVHFRWQFFFSTLRQHTATHTSFLCFSFLYKRRNECLLLLSFCFVFWRREEVSCSLTAVFYTCKCTHDVWRRSTYHQFLYQYHQHVLTTLTHIVPLTTTGREGNGLFFQESWCFWKVVVLTAGNLTWPACFYPNTVRNTNKMHCTRLSPSSALPPSIVLAASTRLRLFSVLSLRQLSCDGAAAITPPFSPSSENKETSFINNYRYY